MTISGLIHYKRTFLPFSWTVASCSVMFCKSRAVRVAALQPPNPTSETPVLFGGGVDLLKLIYECIVSDGRLHHPPSAVEQMGHTSDSQSQILALAFM